MAYTATVVEKAVVAPATVDEEAEPTGEVATDLVEVVEVVDSVVEFAVVAKEVERLAVGEAEVVGCRGWVEAL